MICFDVGSHNGHWFLDNRDHKYRADLNQDLQIHAFEPEPACYQQICDRTKQLENVTVVNAAVANYCGVMPFYLCPDAGCSSLLPFAPGVEKTWDVRNPKWGQQRVPGDDRYRTLEHTKYVRVQVIRLQDYLLDEGITRIDYLHVDTQGSDLEVLRSLGPAIKYVQAGELEVPSSPEKALYLGQHNKEDSIHFLSTAGFKTIYAESNDPFRLEENLFFAR